MVELFNLPKITKKKKKRVGRGLGSGKGAKSTRGTTRHQKAREKIRLGFEGGQNPIIKKFPLLRGKGRNKGKKEKPIVLKVSQLNKIPAGTKVDEEVLKKFGLIEKKSKKVKVKVIDGGELKIPLIVKLKVTASARKKIEAAGGRVI